MNSYVLVHRGRLGNGTVVENVVLEAVSGIKKDHQGKFITVLGGDTPGLRPSKNRLYIDQPNDYEPCEASHVTTSAQAEVESQRTDDEICSEIDETFEILNVMTKAIASNIVKGLVVSGPAGVGKSHTVETCLHQMLAMKEAMLGKPQYECIHGAMSAICLYEKLWEYRNDGQVLVFDDCDGILFDEDCLNILKAALDSRKRRMIHWNTQSRSLERGDIPNSFEYQGGIIFITNLKFDQVRSPRLANHLQAIVSRVHYMDLGIDTMREKMLHIQNVVQRHHLLKGHGFTDTEQQEVLDYITANRTRLREISLRTVTKIADLRAAMPEKWQRFAEKNCMKR